MASWVQTFRMEGGEQKEADPRGARRGEVNKQRTGTLHYTISDNASSRPHATFLSMHSGLTSHIHNTNICNEYVELAS